ncbi:MAG TPA: hypothetical protein DEW32_10190 [Dehalococcoidia bacterium]|nr:hypothetical protein [Dehalococcoidia bacterium]
MLQNFRPGTIDVMGFGYDVLKELNPRIVMVNVSAYGQFGPYREKIGYDPIGQTMSGIAMITGESDAPPTRAGVPIIDRTTALHAALGTMAALYERVESGEGQSIDVCLADTGYSYTEIPISAYHGTGKQPTRGKGPEGAPGGIYPCKDGWVLITAGDQHQWHRVCNALNKPDWLEDPRFTSRPERTKNKDIVNARMDEVLSTMTTKEAIDHFTKHDVTAAPVNTIAEAAEDPHPWERRTMVEVDDFQAGSIAVSGDFWHFSRTPVVIGSAPRVGEHNEDVLGDVLGYSAEEISDLYAKKVIANFDLYNEIPD